MVPDYSKIYSPGCPRDKTLTIIPVNHSPPSIRQPHPKKTAKIMDSQTSGIKPVRRTPPNPRSTPPPAPSNPFCVPQIRISKTFSNTSITKPPAPQFSQNNTSDPPPSAPNQQNTINPEPTNFLEDAVTNAIGLVKSYGNPSELHNKEDIQYEYSGYTGEQPFTLSTSSFDKGSSEENLIVPSPSSGYSYGNYVGNQSHKVMGNNSPVYKLPPQPKGTSCPKAQKEPSLPTPCLDKIIYKVSTDPEEYYLLLKENYVGNPLLECYVTYKDHLDVSVKVRLVILTEMEKLMRESKGTWVMSGTMREYMGFIKGCAYQSALQQGDMIRYIFNNLGALTSGLISHKNAMVGNLTSVINTTLVIPQESSNKIIDKLDKIVLSLQGITDNMVINKRPVAHSLPAKKRDPAPLLKPPSTIQLLGDIKKIRLNIGPIKLIIDISESRTYTN